MGTKKITFNDKTAIIPKAVHENQVWDEDVNEIKDVVNSNADQQIINSQDIENIKNSGSGYQLKANMQNNWNEDISGEKYPQLTLVRNSFIEYTVAFGCSGLISKQDSFLMSDLNTTTLRVSANEKPFLFYNKIITEFENSLKLFPQQDFPLANIPGITVDGTYLRYVAYLDDGTLHFSQTSFSLDDNYCQIGRIGIKRVAGVNTFIDAVGSNRNVKTMPDLAGYNDLQRLYSPLASNVELKPNANMTMNHAGGILSGVSINWQAADNNVKTILAQNPVQFSRIDPSANTATIPPAIVTTFVTSNYWNGVALVAVPTNANATVQRIIMSDNGNIVIQAGELVYDNLSDAKSAFSVAPFTAILPKASYVEIGRIVAVKNANNLQDETQAQFYASAGIGGGGGSASAGTDISISYTATTVLVNSSTGLDGAIGLATATHAGLLGSGDQIIYGKKTFNSDCIYFANGGDEAYFKIEEDLFKIGRTGDVQPDLMIRPNGLSVRAGGISLELNTGLVTAGHVQQFPDKAGTFAMLSDITGSINGTVNYLPKFTSANVLGNSQIIDNGTNVIIGNIPIPTTDKLQVDGSGSFKSLEPYIKLENTQASEQKWLIYNSYSIDGDLSIINQNTSSIPLSIRQSGNVLIGTTTDNETHKLQVDGSAYIKNQVEIGSHNGIATIGSLLLKNNGYDAYISGHTGIDFGTDHLNGNYVVKMRLNYTGNLLIGTTTDNGVDKLQVNGNVSLDKILTIRGNEPYVSIGTLGLTEWKAGMLFNNNTSLIFRANDVIDALTLVADSGNAIFSSSVIIGATIYNGIDRLQVNGSISGTKLTVGNSSVNGIVSLYDIVPAVYWDIIVDDGNLFIKYNNTQLFQLNNDGDIETDGAISTTGAMGSGTLNIKDLQFFELPSDATAAGLVQGDLYIQSNTNDVKIVT